MKDIIKFIYDNNVDNFSDFLMYCISEKGNDDWFEVAIDRNTLAINKMIDGIWQREHSNTRK